MEDGSYLRLKTLQIGYNLPAAWLKKMHMDKFKVYFTGQNLLTFTKYEGYDPEIGSVGGKSKADIPFIDIQSPARASAARVRRVG